MTVIDLRDRSWRVRTPSPRTDEGGKPDSIPTQRRSPVGWRAIGADVAASGLAVLVCTLVNPALTTGMVIALLAAWPVALCTSSGYSSTHRDRLHLPVRPVITAAVRLIAGLAVFSALIGVANSAMVLAALVMASTTALARLAVDRSSGGHRGARSEKVLPVVLRGGALDVGATFRHLDSCSRSPVRVVAVQVLDDGPLPEELWTRVDRRPADESVADAAIRSGARGVIFVGAQGSPSEEVRRAIWRLDDAGLEAYMIPITQPISVPSVRAMGRSGLALLAFDRRDLGSEIGFSKVVGDKILALLLAVALLPAMAAIALGVKLTSRGPVLFRQARVGRGGTEFEMLKFRTMYEDAEARRAELEALNEHEGGTLFKIRDDPRITSVGRVLRKYSLDELPQLINVLRGEMSLVGPRPPLPDEVRHYSEDAHRRFRVRPGLTGLWQVSGRSDLDPVESARLDTHYVEHWSIGMDLTILARTPKVVVTGEGAY